MSSSAQFIQAEQANRAWIEMAQDQRLSAIATNTRALAEKANLIRDAVSEQVIEIEELGDMADENAGLMDKVMRRAAYLLKTNNRRQIKCILILIAVLVGQILIFSLT